MSVSRETEQLAVYAGLLRKWNPAINLIAPSTLESIETRHISDCLQLAEVSRLAQGRWVDLGSGGGFPGIVVAVLRPDLVITMVESDQRKAAFLRNTIRALSLDNAQVLCSRIEQIELLQAGNVSARALAPLPSLMSYVHRHLDPAGKAWLMKGRNWESEIADARKHWTFQVKAHPSTTEPAAAILEITDLSHA